MIYWKFNKVVIMDVDVIVMILKNEHLLLQILNNNNSVGIKLLVPEKLVLKLVPISHKILIKK